MSDIIHIIIAGLTSGSIYGITALAFTIVYNSVKIVNFAQGSMIMAGAMLAHVFMIRLGLPNILVFFLTILCTSLLGLIIKFGIVDPLRKKKAAPYHQVITILGFAIVIDQSFALFVGKQQYNVRSLIGKDPVNLFGSGINVWPENLVLIVATLVCVIAFWFFLTKTNLGRAIQAIGYNPDAAKISGLQTSKLITITFLLSAGLSGLGGMLIAPILGASAYMGSAIGVKGFAAAILGGMGNPFAAFVGGILIGLIETFASYYISSTYAPIIAYAILLIMLIVKPSGLWPEKGGKLA